VASGTKLCVVAFAAACSSFLSSICLTSHLAGRNNVSGRHDDGVKSKEVAVFHRGIVSDHHVISAVMEGRSLHKLD